MVLSHELGITEISYYGTVKGIRKFPSGWKREGACIYEYPADSGKYRMGTRRIYDYDAHGAVVVVDASKPFHEILAQARKWRKYVRDIVYTDPTSDINGNPALTKSDLRGPLTSSEEEMLYQLMIEEAKYRTIENGRVVDQVRRDFRGFSGYSDWFLLSAKSEDNRAVEHALYGALNTVGDFRGWEPLPPADQISKEEL